MSKALKVLLGLVVSAFCLWLVFRGFDFAELQNSLQQASYAWFLPAMVIFCLNMSLRALRWKILLSPLQKINFQTVFPVLVFGFFMNNVLPARGGEVVRAVAANRATGVPVSSILGSIVVERITDLCGLFMIILVAAKLLPWEKLPILPIFLALAGGIVAGLILVIIVQKYRERFQNEPTFVGKVVRFFASVLDGFLALKSPGKMVSVLLLSCGIWINELLQALLVSYAMHLNLSFFESAGLLTGLSVGVMIPAAPGYIGTYEFFGKQVLELLGKTAAQALPFVLVLHFYQLLMMAVVGVPCMMALHSRGKKAES